MKSMWQRLQRIHGRLRMVVREWTGEEEYARLVRCCRAHGHEPPDRGRHFAARLEEKYSRHVRCC